MSGRTGLRIVTPIAASMALAVLTALILSLPAARADESSADISSRISQQQQNMDAWRQQLAEVDQYIAGQESLLEKNRLDLADATSRLRDAEDSYDFSLKTLDNRVAAIYKMGESELYAVLLSSGNVNDAMTRISYLGTISENDLRLVEQVKAEEKEVRRLHDQVDRLKQAQAVNVDDLVQRRQEIQQQIDSGQAQINSDSAALIKAQGQEQAQADAQAIQQAGSGTQSFSFDPAMGPGLPVGAAPPSGLEPTGATFAGLASWYGPGFNGNHTADGEIYDMYGMTAASKTLPFNTWLRVTYNGRSVFVRINDRGPYVGNRILDLSAGAAMALGLSGVGYVRAEIYR